VEGGSQASQAIGGNLRDGADRDSLLHYSEEVEEKATRLEASPDVREGQDKT
jgi:hypothetical protein